MQIAIEDNMELIQIRMTPEVIVLDHHYLDMIITHLVTPAALITLQPQMSVEQQVDQITTPLQTQVAPITLDPTILVEQLVGRIITPPEIREAPTILEPLMLVALIIMAPQVMETAAIMLKVHIIHEMVRLPTGLKLMR